MFTNQMTNGWLPNEDALLCELWGKKKTAKIANELNEQFGRERTSCAVIGRARRLALPKLRSVDPEAPPPKKTRHRAKTSGLPREFRRPPKHVMWDYTPLGRGALLCSADLPESEWLQTNECRWPTTGAGKDTAFCAAPVIEGRSYCAEHCAIAYTPRERRAA